MGATVRTSVSIPESLHAQAGVLARQLNISRTHLFALAIENFIRDYPEQPPGEGLNQPAPIAQQVINQGDVFWVQVEDLGAAEPAIRHPHVVIQDNILNHSRITTVVVCALTSNTKRASSPGNVLLDAGEANLPRQSVVEVSKVSTVDKAQLGDYIGSLTAQRTDQILAGLRFLQVSYFAR